MTDIRNHQFVITGLDQQPSRHGGWIWCVRFTDLASGLEWHTYCDPANRNWRHWRDITDLAQHHIIIVTDLQARTPESRQITADSRPRIHYLEWATETAWQLILDHLARVRP